MRACLKWMGARRSTVGPALRTSAPGASQSARAPDSVPCRKDRKKVEMLFAHLKRILKLDKLRLRGFSGAEDEFLLAATVQNLRRMAMWLKSEAPKPELVPA